MWRVSDSYARRYKMCVGDCRAVMQGVISAEGCRTVMQVVICAGGCRVAMQAVRH